MRPRNVVFLSGEIGILAASPVALVGDNGILKNKCVECKPVEEPFRKTSFLEQGDDKNTQLSVKITHLYYNQILMDNFVAKKRLVWFHQACLEDTYDLVCDKVSRDTTTDTTWKVMKAKLVKFYVKKIVMGWE